MAAESIEVAVQLSDINLHVGCTLCSVYEDGNVARMCHFNDMAHVIDGAQHIAHMGDADELGTRGEMSGKSREIEFALIGYRQVAHHDTTALSLQLPGNDVGVMLHITDQYLVALLHLRFAKRRCHQVDGLCGATGKYDFLRLCRIDELTNLLAGCFMQVGSLL